MLGMQQGQAVLPACSAHLLKFCVCKDTALTLMPRVCIDLSVASDEQRLQHMEASRVTAEHLPSTVLLLKGATGRPLKVGCPDDMHLGRWLVKGVAIGIPGT